MCYHCVEKWNSIHACKNPHIYLLQINKEVSDEEEELPIDEKEEKPQLETLPNSKEELEISLAAIAGTPTVRTMRLVGSILGEQVVILVD